jgi:hypothetical protein
MGLRVLYLANHQSGGGDDEGAIAYALEQLGHTVIRVREIDARIAYKYPADFVLFHHLSDMLALDQLKMKRIGWFFDLVQWPSDPSLDARSRSRLNWMHSILPRCDLMFATDGDFVEEGCEKAFGKRLAKKMVWLPQGADERIVGLGTPRGKVFPPLLFTGIRQGGGKGRVEWVDWMTKTFGNQFYAVGKGLYREALRDAIAATSIVVCPDSPVTDSYWSNRIYVALGFGGCVFHPYCYRLADQYRDDSLVFYRDREELETGIKNYLRPDFSYQRQSVAQNGLEATKNGHLYRHRCEELIRVVKERLL